MSALEETTIRSYLGITLSTHRVRADVLVNNERTVTSMTLDAVAACALRTKSYPLLALLGIVGLLFGLFLLPSRQSGMGVLLLIVGGVMLVLYYFTRYLVFIVSSAGESISVRASSGARDEVLSFINALEEAKLHLLTSLR